MKVVEPTHFVIADSRCRGLIARCYNAYLGLDIATRKVMAKSKKKIDPLPDHFNSLEEAGEFWDTHSGADYGEYMIPVDFDVDLKRRVHEVRVLHEVLQNVTRIARRQGLNTETLINVWLQEKVSDHRRRSALKHKQAARKHSAKKPARSRNGAARAAKA